VIPELIKQYVDTGKARFVSREYPLTSIHSAAQKAAEAAVCAGKQDKYWEMRDKLFAASEEWQAEGADPVALFKKYAQDLGADAAAYNQCLDNGEAALDVQADLMAGQALGVSATPTLFVNDLPIQGSLPIDSLGRIIDFVATGAPAPEIVPAAGDYHLRGNAESARAITVAFVDYASPVSAQHATEVLPQLKSTYVDTGQMLYVLHPWSAKVGDLSYQGALAAECAGEQGKYWEMHDQLFKDQKAWTSAADARQALEGYAGSLGLDKAKFAACLDSDAAKQKVDAGSVVAALYGIPGAPVFLWNNGQGTQGSPTFDEFKAQIDSILNQ
jgi:protein-disulfide isomerase